jgi:Ca-activated chloride channel homolog
MSISRLLVAAIGSVGLAALSLAGLATPTIAATVNIEADLGQSVLHLPTTDRVYLRLSLKSPALTREGNRPPINVAIVIDRSGSMQGDRIRAAKKAARVALERLSSDDIVSLVAYNHDVTVLHEAAPLRSSRRSLERAIDRLSANGTTALYAGVEEGGEQVRDFLSDTKVNRVILLSDGLANVGPSKPSQLARLGRQLASKGITVTTIGLGLDYNEDLMQRLAASSDGNHAFVERPSDLAEIFDKEFGDALSVAARDITIIIECRDGFSPTRVLGRDAEIDGQTIRLKMSQLQAANERYVVVEMKGPKGTRIGQQDIARVKVDYMDLETGSRQNLESRVEARLTDDAGEAKASINKSVMGQVTMQIATEKSEKAVTLRDKGDIKAARKVLEENAAYLERQKATLGSGVGAASADVVGRLKDLETSNRAAASNLDRDDWKKTRKSLRSDQHKTKMQQSY